jgi:hypothetical protein
MKFMAALIAGWLTTDPAFADPHPAQTISQPNSKCEVKSTGGEYPTFTVFKDKKTIYSPGSDGIVKAIISPSGKYLALSAGEIRLLDIEKDHFDYGVVIVNCETGKIKGYRKGKPTLIIAWHGDEGIELADVLHLSGNGGESLP